MNVIKLKLLFYAVSLASTHMLGCQPNSKQASESPKPAVPKMAAGNLARLTGTWISRSRNGFVLLRIQPDSTGVFTWYQDAATAKRPGYPSAGYAFGEIPAKVRYRPQSGPIIYVPNIEVQIWSDGARADYELQGDTLREIDKMGYQGTLVRLHPRAGRE